MKGRIMTPNDLHIFFSRYLHEQNLEALGTLYDENAMFIPGKDQKPIFGRENIKEALKPYLSSAGNVEKISESIYENEDTALIKLEWRLTTEEGKITEGTGLGVAKRTPEGKWVYVIENPYGV